MTVDNLIAALEKVKAEQGGNTVVFAASFCGTNGAHVLFDLPTLKKGFKVADHMNDSGFCLSAEISKSSRKRIADGIADMASKGYRFFRSQFCQAGEAPSQGLSPCEWHNPW